MSFDELRCHLMSSLHVVSCVTLWCYLCELIKNSTWTHVKIRKFMVSFWGSAICMHHPVTTISDDITWIFCLVPLINRTQLALHSKRIVDSTTWLSRKGKGHLFDGGLRKATTLRSWCLVFGGVPRLVDRWISNFRGKTLPEITGSQLGMQRLVCSSTHLVQLLLVPSVDRLRLTQRGRVLGGDNLSNFILTANWWCKCFSNRFKFTVIQV